MRIFATITVAVLLLAGCGGSKDGTTGTPPASTPTAAPVAASTTPTVPPTVAPKPATPAVLTRAQAAKRYLEIVKPYNDAAGTARCKALDEFEVEGGEWPPADHRDWPGEEKVGKACFKTYLATTTKEIQDLQATLWPVDAKDDMADLISLDQAYLHCWRAASKVSASATYQCLPQDDGSADRVRARFGLPGRTAS